MATLKDVLAAIEASPATKTTCVQAICKLGITTLIVSDGAPPTDGEYRYDLTAFEGDGATMTEFTDDEAGIIEFFSLFASCADLRAAENWEISTVRHYF